MKSLRSSSSLLPIMKRQRPNPTPPSTPPTPQTLHKTLQSKPKTAPIIKTKNPRRNILNDTNPTPPITLISSKPQTLNWVPLSLPNSELYLPLTFPTGQTFRWKQTGSLQFTGVVGSHIFSLKHLDNGDVAYCLHNHNPTTTTISSEPNNAVSALLDFLNVGVSLCDMWEEFSISDSRFAELARYLGGARVLRQDPVECLMQFLCSSNNNIGRITKMVDFVSSLGNHLGNVEGLDFYEFPSLERLSLISEKEFREAGFGYRYH